MRSSENIYYLIQNQIIKILIISMGDYSRKDAALRVILPLKHAGYNSYLP